MQFNKLGAIQARHHMQHATRYHTAMLEKAPWVYGVGEMRFGTSTAVRVAGESAEIICFVAPEDHHHFVPSTF